MRHVVLALLVVLIALPAFAVDLGRAEGALVIDGNRIPLGFAYAIRKQKNQLTNKNDTTRIILSDKALADDANLTELDSMLPDGINGVIISIDGAGKVVHVAVQHPTGIFDAGYFEGIPDYEYKSHRGDPGSLAGSVSSSKVKTNTMTFYYDATFSAALK